MKLVLNNQGFTIIETLVAITILLISISGPLTVANKGLTAAVTSQDQMTASYLAQDLMEYVKNVRDDNLIAGHSWLTNSYSNLLSCTVGHSHCDFDTLAQYATTPTFALCTLTNFPSLNLCDIYLYNGYYTPDSNSLAYNSQLTRFSRAFTITPENESSPGDPTTATSVLLTVTVSWKTAGVSNQVVVQNILFNTLR